MDQLTYITHLLYFFKKKRVNYHSEKHDTINKSIQYY